jgi:hypothetical protein
MLRDPEVAFAISLATLGGLQNRTLSKTFLFPQPRETKPPSQDQRAEAIVRSMLRTLSDLSASPEIERDIAEAKINVLRLDVINACAVPSVDRPKIVLFSGLIRAFMFMIEFNQLTSTIVHHKAEVLAAAAIDEGELNGTGYQAFTLLGHFAMWQTPLPRPWPSISRNLRGALILELAKVLWFVVVHELAHIKLGHLESLPEADAACPILPALALDEGASGLKLREFEADEHIIASLSPAARPMFLSWALLPLEMFASLERLMSNYRDTHPMAINRLNHLKARAKAMGVDFVETVDAMLDRQVLAQEAYRASSQNHAFHTSYEMAANALRRMQSYAAFARSLDADEAETRGSRHADVWDALTDHFGDAD